MKEYFINLSKSYPLAYEEFEGWEECNDEWPSGNEVGMDWVFIPSSIRDLYDWFDPLGIMCEPTFVNSGFGWTIEDNKNCEIWNYEDVRDNRTLAEMDLFTKAFEIREEQLKAKQKPVKLSGQEAIDSLSEIYKEQDEFYMNKSDIPSTDNESN